MYEIEEINKFGKLANVSINLYYLNRAAKYNFSLKMGVQPVNYGNVFCLEMGSEYGHMENIMMIHGD